VSGLVEPGANELFVGKATSLRKTRTGGPRNKQADTNDQLECYRLPKFVLRREGDRLRSLFATVLEPYSGPASRIDRIERLVVEPVPEPDIVPDLEPDFVPTPANEPSLDPAFGNRLARAAAVAISYGEVTDYVISSCEPRYRSGRATCCCGAGPASSAYGAAHRPDAADRRHAAAYGRD
jgi:hypothetical protein